MAMTTSPNHSRIWQRTTWVGVLTLAAIVSTFTLACATPFAALIALAVLFLPRKDAWLLIGINFAANQAIGFAFLHYPLTLSCFLGGFNLALACVVSAIAAMAAQKALVRTGPLLSVLGVFAASAVVFQAVLHVGLAWRPDEMDLRTDLDIIYLNGLAFLGLLAMQYAAMAFGLAAPRGATRAPAAP
jgi:hypothetical protein